MFEKIPSIPPHKFLRTNFNPETIHINDKKVKEVGNKLNIGIN